MKRDIIPTNEETVEVLDSIRDSDGFLYEIDEPIVVTTHLTKSIVTADVELEGLFSPSSEIAYTAGIDPFHVQELPLSFVIDHLNMVRDSTDCYICVETFLGCDGLVCFSYI